jgi:hypothetical protein
MFISRPMNLKTELSQIEIVNLLKKKTQAKKSKNKDNFFVGYVSDYSFNLMRDIQYQNSFLPVVTGVVENTPDGSKITANLALLKEVQIALFIFYGFIFLVTLRGLFLIELNIKALILLVPSIVGLLVLLLMRACFNPEADTIEVLFSQLLKTHPIQK